VVWSSLIGTMGPTMDSDSLAEVKRLADKGYELLRDEDYEAARDIAAQLEDLRYSAAFEIGAQAQAGLGDLDKAVEILERGVSKAPTVWLLWHLLGNYRSDLGRFDEAADAYDRALQCDGVHKDWVFLNQGIMFGRRGEHAKALDQLNMVKDPDLDLVVASSLLPALDGLGRSQEALSVAQQHLHKKADNERDARALAFIAYWHCRLRLSHGEEKDEVRSEAMDAIAEFGPDEDLLALVRDIDEQYSAASKYYRLLVHAALPQNHELRREVQGYFIKYDVVAETPEEALGFVREFENAEFPAAELRIEEAEQLEDRPEDPKGVYHFTGRNFYEDEDDE
jgi:tetratricopeptide (TPR) repeat protein